MLPSEKLQVECPDPGYVPEAAEIPEKDIDSVADKDRYSAVQRALQHGEQLGIHVGRAQPAEHAKTLGALHRLELARRVRGDSRKAQQNTKCRIVNVPIDCRKRLKA